MLSSTRRAWFSRRIQSCVHMRASAIFGLSELWKESSTQLPALKADSDATVYIGTARTSFAVKKSTLYFDLVVFHQYKISKPSSSSFSQSSTKYLSNSDSDGACPLLSLCFLYIEVIQEPIFPIVWTLTS